MTFYNVISGILFLGACQALVHEMGTPTAWYAATLVALMCNESVLTSELLEGANPYPYTLKMKLWDLLTFFVLAYALLVLSPDTNAFGSSGEGARLFGAGIPAFFLLLLALYGLFSIVWNGCECMYSASFSSSRVFVAAIASPRICNSL